MLAAALLLAPLTLVRPDLAPGDLEAAYARPPSAFLEVEGLRVHHRDTGDGEALVLLHGSNASLHTWEGWREELTPEHRVVTLDLPGHGLTGPDPRARYDADAMADLVLAFADAIGLDTFAVGGSSMGGGVAWRVALAAPERITGLVLVSATGYPQEGGPPLLYRLARVPGVGAALTRLTPRFLVAAMLRDAYGDGDRLDDAVIDRYWKMLRREGNRQAARERLSAGGHGSAPERIRELRVPTLVVWGGADTWVPVAHAHRFVADVPGARLVLHDHLGHLPMEEDPETTAADVAELLGSAPERAGSDAP